MEDSSEHFKNFASDLSALIARKYGLPEITDKTVTELQKKQVELLAQLENDFRLALIKHKKGPQVYQNFVKFICVEKRNILAARPYFRERQTVFTQEISGALKENKWRRLYKFNINYQFVTFAAATVKWPKNSKVLKLKKQIEDTRTALVETNLPLAIQRSRMFWNKTPKSHLSLMDFIQTATEGLIAAIDKFVLPYSKVFRSVAIGRMVGNFIEEYSGTHLHFYPTDRRKIYRANKYMAKTAHGGVDFQKMADYVNEKSPSKKKSTSAEISNLVSAASTVSTDSTVPGDEEVENISKYTAPENTRPDVRVENADAFKAIHGTFGSLTLIEKKLLRLKGIDIELE